VSLALGKVGESSSAVGVGAGTGRDRRWDREGEAEAEAEADECIRKVRGSQYVPIPRAPESPLGLAAFYLEMEVVLT